MGSSSNYGGQSNSDFNDFELEDHPDRARSRRSSAADASRKDRSGRSHSEGPADAPERSHEALVRLQEKASELTARFVDRVNVDDMTRTLEQQVRAHPARTLLMAVGVGYLLGRASK